MSQEARYFRVGVFVLVGAALIVGGLLALGGGKFLRESVTFETVFDESVQGLEVGSSVKFRGAMLGRVSAIGTVSEFYPGEDLSQDEQLLRDRLILVRFEMNSESGTGPADVYERAAHVRQMIKRGLRLRITPLGITGTSFVEADYVDPQTNPPMKITWEPEVIYVPSTRSTLRKFSAAFEDFLQRLDHLEVEGVVDNLDELLAQLRRAVEQLDLPRLVNEGTATLNEIAAAMEEVRSAVAAADLGGLSGDARNALEEADQTLARLRQSIDGGSYDLELALENLRVTTENLRDLSNTLREQPSLLLRSAPPSP